MAVQMFFPVSVISGCFFVFFVAIFVATSIIMRKEQHAYILNVIILFLWVNTSKRLEAEMLTVHPSQDCG